MTTDRNRPTALLERELVRRVSRYINVDRAGRYVVETGERLLGYRVGLTEVAKRQVKEQERPVVDRYVERALLAGGWPGHVQERVDALAANLEAVDAPRLDRTSGPANVVPIAAAPSSTMTGRPPRVPGPPPGPPGPDRAA